MIKVMDFNLWHISDSLGIGTDDGYEQPDFNFRYVPDIIEENAINEKCCVEVLHHMIAKADTEVLDLEDDLAILQSQLRWAENEKLYEVCSSVFREKITFLSRSLQTLRKEYTPNSNALNADSGTHHEPAERIRDIITALLENNNSTESKKEPIIVKADIEEQEKITSETASLGFSREPDNKQISETENQVLDNDIKGQSNAVQGATAVNGSEAIILLQQDCEGKDETEQPKLSSPLPVGVKADFDENEPLAMLLNSPPPKRKKVQNPTRSRTEIAKESNQNFCVTTAFSKLSPASEVSRKNSDSGRKNSAEKIHPVITNENPDPASDGISQLVLLAEMKNPSLSTHSLETKVSECTREKLEKMKMVDLMAVAKRHGLKKYYKTKKSLLVDMILSKIG